MSRKNHHSRTPLRRKRMRLLGYDYSQDGQYFVTIDCNNMEWRFGNIYQCKMILNDFGEIAFNEWIKLPVRYENVQLHEFQFMPNHMHAIIELINPYNNENLVGAGLASAPCNNTEASLVCTETKTSLVCAETKTSLVCTEAEASPVNTNLEIGRDDNVREGLASSVGTYLASSLASSLGNHSDVVKHQTLSDIMCAYKSIVANTCLDIHKQKFIGLTHVPLLGKIWKRSFYDHIIRDQASYKAITHYIRNNPKKWARDK